MARMAREWGLHSHLVTVPPKDRVNSVSPQIKTLTLKKTIEFFEALNIRSKILIQSHMKFEIYDKKMKESSLNFEKYDESPLRFLK